jgi:hypothetical protein
VLRTRSKISIEFFDLLIEDNFNGDLRVKNSTKPFDPRGEAINLLGIKKIQKKMKKISNDPIFPRETRIPILEKLTFQEKKVLVNRISAPIVREGEFNRQ